MIWTKTFKIRTDRQRYLLSEVVCIEVWVFIIIPVFIRIY
jgi:hypothetical protein